MGQALAEEVCPNCGDFVGRLLPSTGWCVKCSMPTILGLEGGDAVAEIKICDCGKSVGDSTHKKCRTCRDAEWLSKHADEIDRCLANGISLYKARILISQHERAQIKCLSCNGPLNKAARGTSYFCRKPQCRSAQRKLKGLIYEKGYDRNEALKTVLEELKSGNRTDD